VTTRGTIAGVAARLLAERGPLEAAELGRALAEAGATRSRDTARTVAAALGPDTRFSRLDDGRWAHLPSVLDGAVLAHRLSGSEAAGEVVELDPDLTPIAPLVTPGLQLVGGGTLRRGRADDWNQATGPSGWLGGAEEATLIGFRLRGGRLELGTLSEPGGETRMAAHRLVAAARARLVALEPLFDQPAAHVGRLVVELLVELPRLLDQPLGPLGGLLESAGLEVRGSLIGHKGTDWSAWDPGAADEPSAALGDARRRHPGGGLGREPEGAAGPHPALGDIVVPPPPGELDEAGAEALAIAVGAVALFGRDGRPPADDVAASLAQVLSYPRVADALAAEAQRDPALEQFLAPIAAAASGRSGAAPRFLLAVCAEARGDRDTAQALLAEALSADPAFAPALLRAARYAGERGDTDAVLALLARAGVELEPAERRRLERFARNGDGGRAPDG
jgi:hypothetical protein